jgi:DNA-binding transcriptional ArsR family regulator
MLWALVDGRALPAGELARTAGVQASTASSHLSRLVAAGWLGVEHQGRHRYMRLINGDVAGLLEALAVVGGAPPDPPEAGRGPPEELRMARSCYDHLAGRAGVALAGSLVSDGSMVEAGRIYTVTPAGKTRLARLGIDVERLAGEALGARRYLARACVDWSERRHHIAGALGQALLACVLERGWFERRRGSRALRLTNQGRRALWREFGIRLV